MKNLIIVLTGILFLFAVSAPATVGAENGTNLIINPSLEIEGAGGIPSGWTTGGWGENTASFAYPVAGHDGSSAIRIEITSYVSGDAKWYFQEVPVSPGTIYEFSDYYRSSVQSYITMRYTLANGSFVYEDITKIGANPSENWTQFSDSFLTPNDAVSVTIFHLIKEVGYLETDDYFLKKSEADDSSHFGQGIVSFNFDDGYSSVYENALPILSSAGFKSDHFIVTGYSLEDFPVFMTKSQVLDIQSKGHSIGSHGVSHVTSIGEVLSSRTALLEAGIFPVNFFSYVYGYYNNELIEAVKEAGYSGAVSTDIGYNLKTTNPFALKRITLDINTTIEQVKDYIDKAVDENLWLIFSLHRISTDYTTDIYNNLPETFEQIVNYLKEQNVEVVTLEEGLALTQNTTESDQTQDESTKVPTSASPSIVVGNTQNGSGGNGPVSLGNYTGSPLSAPTVFSLIAENVLTPQVVLADISLAGQSEKNIESAREKTTGQEREEVKETSLAVAQKNTASLGESLTIEQILDSPLAASIAVSDTNSNYFAFFLIFVLLTLFTTAIYKIYKINLKKSK